MVSGADGDIRVLSVVHSPTYAGAHNQLLRLHGPLRDLGVETIAALPEEADEAADRLRAAGVEVHTLPLARLRATANPLTQGRFLSAAHGDVGRLADLVAATRVDVVQVHGVQNPQGAIAGRRRGVAVVWQLLDTRAPMALRRLCMPLVRRLADSIVSWGVAVADGHPGARRFGDRLVVVYPPVDVGAFAPDAASRRAARQRLGVGDDQVLVGTVGVRYRRRAMSSSSAPPLGSPVSGPTRPFGSSERRAPPIPGSTLVSSPRPPHWAFVWARTWRSSIPAGTSRSCSRRSTCS